MSSKEAIKQATDDLKQAEESLEEIIGRAETIRAELEAATKQREALHEDKRVALAAFAENGDPKELDAIDGELVNVERKIAGLTERAAAVQEFTGPRKRPIYEAEVRLKEATEAYWRAEEQTAIGALREVATPLIVRAMACRRAYDTLPYKIPRYLEVILARALNLSEVDVEAHIKDGDGVSASPTLSALLTDLERQDFARAVYREEKAPYREAQAAESEQKAAAFKAKDEAAQADAAAKDKVETQVSTVRRSRVA